MKKLEKRLRLQRETILPLAAHQLAEVKGGGAVSNDFTCLTCVCWSKSELCEPRTVKA